MSAVARRKRVVEPEPTEQDHEIRSKARKRFVQDIVRHHFGEKPHKLLARSGGLTNAVYTFKVAHGEFVLRTQTTAGKVADYLKEQWAMDAARTAGVPTPKVLEVGNSDSGDAYMITERVRGIDGCNAPNRHATLEMLGRSAATLHGIPTHGFGSVFDWSSNQLSRHETWHSWLTAGFDVEERLRVLRQNGLLDDHQVGALREVAETMGRWRKPAVLHHGDLRLKNTIVDADTGQLVALIDWESATSLPAPYWDLSLGLHDLGVDEKEAFLSGYGIGARALLNALPFIRLFNVLNYAGPAERAALASDRAALERFRARFRGALDLYRL